MKRPAAAPSVCAGRPIPPAAAACRVEVVVARFRERVEWTRNVPPEVAVTIYDKGGDLDPRRIPRARVVTLANVGHEAHTYLSHLVERYDSLAPVTVFCQGHPFDHAPDLHALLRRLAAGDDASLAFRWIGFIVDTDDARGRRLFAGWSKNRAGRELELDRFHRELFGEPAPEWVRFRPGGQFALAADLARTRPRALYAEALRLSETFPDAGHCFERLWDRVFGVVGVPPDFLGDALCRYLKPIRRLAERGTQEGEDACSRGFATSSHAATSSTSRSA